VCRLAIPLFETGVAGVLLDNAVERSTFLADVVATSGTADLRVKQEDELVKATQTMPFIERAILGQ